MILKITIAIVLISSLLFLVSCEKGETMTDTLSDFNFEGFWKEKDSEEVLLTQELIQKAEKELGYKLPVSYINLLRNKNGGYPVNKCIGTKSPTSWADDHIAITEIYGIQNEGGILGDFGSNFWIEEWDYPAIGIYIAECPSAGHDMICLDYSECGAKGEPRVIHIDQEFDYKITIVANNFGEFIRNLTTRDKFAYED